MILINTLDNLPLLRFLLFFYIQAIQLKSRHILLFDKSFRAVFLAKKRLLNLACGVARHWCENNLLRTLVSRKLVAELLNLVKSAAAVRLRLDNRTGNLAETLVRKTDYRDILDLWILLKEILYLDRVDVLSAADDYVFLAVYKVIKPSSS